MNNEEFKFNNKLFTLESAEDYKKSLVFQAKELVKKRKEILDTERKKIKKKYEKFIKEELEEYKKNNISELNENIDNIRDEKKRLTCEIKKRKEWWRNYYNNETKHKYTKKSKINRRIRESTEKLKENLPMSVVEINGKCTLMNFNEELMGTFSDKEWMETGRNIEKIIVLKKDYFTSKNLTNIKKFLENCKYPIFKDNDNHFNKEYIYGIIDIYVY